MKNIEHNHPRMVFDFAVQSLCQKDAAQRARARGFPPEPEASRARANKPRTTERPTTLCKSS